jgi:protein-S-isoprenylcysteine O-methyltransferase Ste14
MALIAPGAGAPSACRGTGGQFPAGDTRTGRLGHQPLPATNPGKMITVWSTRLRNVPLPEPFLFGLGTGMVLHQLWPRRLPGSDTVHRVLGWSLLGVGGALVTSAWRAAGQVDLGRPARLVSAGPYEISRNPMYVGWGLLHLGAALTVGSAWIAATFPLSAIWLHHQVLGEERQLDDAFGEEFRRWRATVPRYLGFRRPRRAA